VADLIQEAGADHILIMDMHSPQLQGFFSIPCDHLLAAPTIMHYLTQNWDLKNYILVAADAGAAKSLKTYADGLRLPVAIMDKRRDNNDEQPKVKGVIGNVKGKQVLIIDDEVASGRTLARDAEYLIKHAGAKSVDACVTHAVLGPGAAKILNDSPIDRLIFTDTVPTEHQKIKKKEVISVTSVFAECIKRIHQGESIMSINEPTSQDPSSKKQ
jgi:ribose-phosphate pyrophosphokinase